MANAQKGRGDRAEREAAELLSLLLGLPIRRKLGAGRLDDQGDLDGLSGFALQVVLTPEQWARLVLELRAGDLAAGSMPLPPLPPRPPDHAAT